ncbi:hypothetical protein DPMN_038864 [Dreissena polymorpha]|uniref:Uncharacterized protein n=1 Tax=Dreissena polymorpha TaxID=45954 RepID=A0A9D4RR35_DREPO|nr:hypothetical protein DPMN_038864 [Dreissena polymorpha]
MPLQVPPSQTDSQNTEKGAPTGSVDTSDCQSTHLQAPQSQTKSSSIEQVELSFIMPAFEEEGNAHLISMDSFLVMKCALMFSCPPNQHGFSPCHEVCSHVFLPT